MSDEKEKNISNSNNFVETNIKVIGDKTTVCQVVQLLAYIRHAIKNSERADITVKVGRNIADGHFLFDVNGLEIPDLITQKFVDIN